MKCDASFEERFQDHIRRKMATIRYNLKYQNPSDAAKTKLGKLLAELEPLVKATNA